MVFLFTIAIFLSAFLLFLVQPMVGKIFLPWVGGAPAAWNTCMFFFQFVLLGGYYYAHATLKHLSLKKHFIVHFVLMLTAIVFLPIKFSGTESVPTNPAPWLLTQLLITVALPFFVLSSSAPIIQKWFYHCDHKRSANPFFLYAASNAGSFSALIIYPLFVEPTYNTYEQGVIWSIGYVLTILLMGLCAFFVNKSIKKSASKDLSSEIKDENAEKNERTKIEANNDGAKSQAIAKPGFFQVIKWVFAAFIPSSLFLGCTQFMTRDIAPVPMLWVIPLMIYLFTFIVAFAEKFVIKLSYIKSAALISMVVFFPVYYLGAIRDTWTNIFVHLAILFAIALMCHRYLSDTKPVPEYLTTFFLCLSIGGVMGGLFNSFIAVELFDAHAEYPLVIALSAIIINASKSNATNSSSTGKMSLLASVVLGILFAGATWFIYYIPLTSWFFKIGSYFSFDNSSESFTTAYNFLSTHHREFRFFVYFILGLYTVSMLNRKERFNLFAFSSSVMIVLMFVSIGLGSHVIYRSRNFFGVKEVILEDYRSVRKLVHGTTVHGVQSLDPEWQQYPLSYYHFNGPLGDVFASGLGRKEGLRVAGIGLGAGSMAAYLYSGQHMTFYEIDPEIVEIAKNIGAFTYLGNAQGTYDVVVGDGRLKIAQAEDESYDIIVVDAFSSDYIPVHLMTVEAVGIYLEKLKEDGLLVFNISNRYLDMQPLADALAREHGLVCLITVDNEFDSSFDENWNRYASVYAVMSRNTVNLPIPWVSNELMWKMYPEDNDFEAWTDDFSSLLPLMIFN